MAMEEGMGQRAEAMLPAGALQGMCQDWSSKAHAQLPLKDPRTWASPLALGQSKCMVREHGGQGGE